jgi:hypothetical protein
MNRGTGDLRGQVRPSRRAVASRLLHSIGAKPGRWKEISGAAEGAQGEPRSVAERESCSGTGSRAAEVGRSHEGPLCLPEENHSAHPRGERQQRRDRVYSQLLHSPAESPERAVDPLSRRESRITVSISGALCCARDSLFERVKLYRTRRRRSTALEAVESNEGGRRRWRSISR